MQNKIYCSRDNSQLHSRLEDWECLLRIQRETNSLGPKEDSTRHVIESWRRYQTHLSERRRKVEKEQQDDLWYVGDEE